MTLLSTLIRRNIAFFLIAAAYCLYAGIYIYNTSFVINGERTFSLFDDAMISMRYAKNLVHGQGLVWNPGGPRLEGYTNSLWVLTMAALHLVPIATSKICLLVQILGAFLLLVNLWFIKGIAEHIAPGSRFVSSMAVLLTAFYFSLNYWGLLGMEVSAVTLIMSISVRQALRAMAAKRVSLASYLCLGVGTLIRPDMAIPLVVLLAFFWIADPRNRRANVLAAAVTLAVFLGGQTACRWWYFHDIVPNTYYLKMTGYPALLRISRGIYVLGLFALKLGLLPIIVPILTWRFRRSAATGCLLALFLGQAVYSVYIGGDISDLNLCNRFLCIVMPLLFVLFAVVLEPAYRWILARYAARSGEAGLPAFRPALLFLLALAGIAVMNAPIPIPMQIFLKPVYQIDTNNYNVIVAQVLSGITTPGAKIAVNYSGVPLYFVDRIGIDLLGKCDSVIAHEEMHQPPPDGFAKYTFFYPGHLKWDYAYSLGKLNPDVIADPLNTRQADALPYLAGKYVSGSIRGVFFYLRKDSRNILWDKVKK